MNEYYREAPNKVVSGADGIAYANREVGVGAVRAGPVPAL